MINIETHRRTIDTLTGPAERRLLHWLAAHMPGWMTPDWLTAIGRVGSLVTFAGYGLTRLDKNYLWLASLGFFINWFGDSLDGTLARYRHIERPRYGFFIDHVMDCFTEVLIFLGLGLSPYVRFDLACLALIGYLVLSNLVFIYTCVTGEFKISYGKLGPTEDRLIAVGGNVVVWVAGNPVITRFIVPLTIYDWIALGVIVLLVYFILTAVFKQGRLIAKEEAALRH